MVAEDGVENVEDLHVWTLSSHIAVASVFVTDSASSDTERDALVERIHEFLESEYDVTHSSVGRWPTGATLGGAVASLQ